MERRDFLQWMISAGLGTLLLPAPVLATSGGRAQRGFHDIEGGPQLQEGKAKAVILIWLAGGMAHTETFDPKPRVEFRKGLESRQVLSTFDSIPTAIDSIRFSAGLGEIASVMDRGSLVRSWKGPDLGPVLHTRHQYHWHTGYVPPQALLVPHIGSWVSQVLGPRNDYAPQFVEIGQSFDFGGAEEVRAYFTGGFLGSEFGPLHIPDPLQAVKSLKAPERLGQEGLRKRFEIFQKLYGNTDELSGISDFHRNSIARSVESAERLLFSPALQAFQIENEPRNSFQRYNTGKFGIGCLLARRLIEAGSRFVEVSSEYVPFGMWDTHKNGHSRTKQLKEMVDMPIAQLVRDLEERGILSETLVIVASEFSRVAGRNPGREGGEVDMILANASHYGLHRHFIDAGSVLFFGGGIRPGVVYGETRNEFPCDVVRDPVSVSDLHATMFHLLGIPPDFGYEVEARPFFVTSNGKGRVIDELIGRVV
ncbi:MAG: DUF1501 domain-containing protein [Bdellovibrionales bacterium]|nr:DUF1501 domain-containing protein [Bdellovibrionales bacterium]